MNNPFEGKAIKFATEQELNHLAELARGYGFAVGGCEFKSYTYFRSSSDDKRCYDTYSIPKPTDIQITYPDFIASLERTKQPDMVNHPPHYTVNGIEVIDVIENYKLNYRLGNVVKYVLRSDLKGNRLQDLKKALWYLQREIEQSEKQK
jgi:hypothetical protein